MEGPKKVGWGNELQLLPTEGYVVGGEDCKGRNGFLEFVKFHIRFREFVQSVQAVVEINLCEPTLKHISQAYMRAKS